MCRRTNIFSIALLLAGLGGCGTADLALGPGLDSNLKPLSVELAPANHEAPDKNAKALAQLVELEAKPGITVRPALAQQASSPAIRRALYDGNEILAAKIPRLMGRREIKVGIFGFDEIRLGRSEFFEKWSGALQRHMENQVTQTLLCAKGVFSLCSSSASKFDSSLFSLRQTDKHLPAVNHHVNKVSYVEDAINYEQKDYWAAPREFFSKGGDCEDYAIAKYLLLRELGIDPDSMRIVVVMDELRDTAHAILAVYLPDDILVLDNLSRSIGRHQYVSNYVPIYSVNEKHAWLHTRHKTR